MRFAPITLFILVCLLGSAGWAATWTVVDPQFHKSTADVTGIDAAGVHLAGGALLKWDDVLQMDTAPTTSNAPGDYTLYMTDGDHITGQPISLGNDFLKWQSAVLGAIDIPVLRLQAIAKGKTLPDGLDDTRKLDIVKLANGDSANGLIIAMTGDSLTLQSGHASPVIPLAKVSAALFAAPPNTPHGQRQFRVRLSGGESIVASSLAMDANSATIWIDGKATLALPAATVVGLEQLNGPMSWLTSLTPSENIYRPFFQESFPTRFDRTVADGKPIRERYPAFHHGIGCHAYAKLTYDLDGSQQAFRTQFAIDGESLRDANVDVRIYLDGKPVFEEKGVKAGPPHAVVTVPLKDAKKLSLEVDYGKNFATQARFVWLDPSLVKSPSAAAPTTQP